MDKIGMYNKLKAPVFSLVLLVLAGAAQATDVVGFNRLSSVSGDLCRTFLETGKIDQRKLAANGFVRNHKRHQRYEVQAKYGKNNQYVWILFEIEKSRKRIGQNFCRISFGGMVHPVGQAQRSFSKLEKQIPKTFVDRFKRSGYRPMIAKGALGRTRALLVKGPRHLVTIHDLSTKYGTRTLSIFTGIVPKPGT